jgi:hypothetical protein
LWQWKYSIELRGGGEGKENDRKSAISKWITSVKVEDIGCVLKAVEKWGMRGKG